MPKHAANTTGWVLLGLIGLAIAWLLTRGRTILHESVTAQLIPSQVGTGYPQFYSSTGVGMPAGTPVHPVGSIIEGVTDHPSDPYHATCPEGYQIFHDVDSDAYFCFPRG